MIDVNSYLLLGIAARIVLRHGYSVSKLTNNDKLLTIRAATPYNDKRKQLNMKLSIFLKLL